ncbi:MAG TPA: hypothetical protein VJO52_16360 [Gemmatimonadaceae bacterium]|nr:hypothetical protein [Gemmatimonadaceae bacterium]
MRHANEPRLCGCLCSLSILAALASPSALQAQTQNSSAIGTKMIVRIIERVNTGSDPAGKQYRAVVTRSVAEGNGVAIASGAHATVTLTGSGSAWVAHVSTVATNGQAVAVASSLASATTVARTDANAMHAMLGGLGNHAPAAVSAIASGQQIVMPPGTTLTFILAQSPAPNSGAPPVSGSTTSSQPAAKTPAPAPAPAAAPAPGQGSWYLCTFSGFTSSRRVVYVSSYSHTGASATAVQSAWFNFVRQTYPVAKLGSQKADCEAASSDPQTRAFSLSYEDTALADGKTDVTHVNWSYAAGEVPPKAMTPADTATALQRGEFYLYCFSDQSAPIVYFSEVFIGKADSFRNPPDFGSIGQAYLVFLEQKYAFKSASGLRPSCFGWGNDPQTLGSKRYSEDRFKKANKQIVETGWKYTK